MDKSMRSVAGFDEGDNMKNKRAYYARPISVDGTKQEGRDLDLIVDLGFAPYPTGKAKQEILAEYRQTGIDVFRLAVKSCAALFFRAFPDGSIGAGVAKEIACAQEAGIPVIEIPRQIERRTLSVEDTRAMLVELGQR